MRKLLLTILLVICFNNFAQQPLLIGKWKTIEVSSEEFFVGRNDSITLHDDDKRSRISAQNKKASVRIECANNVFVFTGGGDFSYYLSDNPRSLTFVGKYTLADRNIFLKVKNPANIELNKKAEYYFKNGELHLKMHAEGNHPINYVLQRTGD